MATDQSPPRNNLILSIAVVTVIILIGLKFVFDSYFSDMMEAVAAAKVPTPEEVVQLHAEEQKKLTTSPAVPIDQAMQMLASKGRMGSADITPQPSNDLGAVAGWAHLHDGEENPPPAPTAALPAAAGDAGIMTTTPPGPPPGFDGGAGALPNATDAGAPKPHAGGAPAPTTSAAPSLTAGSPAPTTSAAP